MKFSDDVKYARKILKLSQQKLADSIGVNRLTVFRWETDYQRPILLLRFKFYEFCWNKNVTFPPTNSLFRQYCNETQNDTLHPENKKDEF